MGDGGRSVATNRRTSSFARPRPLPVLLVEDDFDIREALVDLLTTSGYHVVACADADEACMAVREGLVPALLVTDLTLPTMSGVQLIRALRAQAALSDLPAVLATANDVPAHIPENTHFLRKPFDVERLLTIMASHLRPARGEDARTTKRVAVG